MSKYNFDIDLSSESSTGLVINKIKKGSIILEFGCANGRMTKYFKDKLKCKVYIVEFDKDAFNEAINYAEDGICCDILTFNWYKKFSNIEFDYILFVDVLEHLINPNDVLNKSSELLKNSGKTIISIPNITHNDILLKMYDNNFDYTNIGLLDDTHVHFWGLNNIPSLIKDGGLYLESIENTIKNTGETEQYNNNFDIKKHSIYPFINNRICGNVYQFIITASKSKLSDYQLKDYYYKYDVIKSNICLYNNDLKCQTITYYLHKVDNNIYQFNYEIKDVSNLKEIIIKLVDDNIYKLDNISITQNNKNISYEFNNGLTIDDKLYLLQGGFLKVFGINNECSISIRFNIIINFGDLFNDFIILIKRFINENNMKRDEIYNLKNIIYAKDLEIQKNRKYKDKIKGVIYGRVKRNK